MILAYISTAQMYVKVDGGISAVIRPTWMDIIMKVTKQRSLMVSSGMIGKDINIRWKQLK